MKTNTTKIGYKATAVVCAFAMFFVFALSGCSKETQSGEESVYTVTFDSNGGSAVESQSVAPGGKVARPLDPIKEGYSFVDWYADASFVVAWGFETRTVTRNITLYAMWDDTETAYYTVSFESNGGSAVDSRRVASGRTVPRPTDPELPGYTFVGWYADHSLSVAWNFDTMTVSGNTVMYAKWKYITGQDEDDVKDDDNNNNNDNDDDNDDVGGGEVGGGDVGGGEVGGEVGGGDVGGGEVGGGDEDDGDDNDVGGGEVGDDNGDGTVTVTFNAGYNARVNGMSNPPAQTVNSGSKITKPQNTESGYILNGSHYILQGWYAEEGSAAWNFTSNAVTHNTTLYAKWVKDTDWSGSSGDADDSSDYVPTMKAANTLYIHYYRGGGGYTGWEIYNWGNGETQWISSYVTDESGAVYAIDLTSDPCRGSSTINFIVAKEGWADKDGGDNSVTLSAAMKVENSYHWFVTQGNTANGTNKFTGASSGNSDADRATVNDVDRSYARNLPVMPTATSCDDMGVGYQIFVASFCDSNGDGVGDIRGIINKLDYLDTLNVDVLWLTPVQSSNSYHGYDCYDYYCIDSKFGTNADYRELVYKAHQHGMKIIMDLVINHTSPQNEWFIKSKAGVVETVTYQDGTTATVKYRDFYRWSNNSDEWNDYPNTTRTYPSGNGDGWYFYSSFGDSMPELNYDCQAVRNAMADVAAYWMSFGLDGFRLDAIKHLFMWNESDNLQSDEQGGANDVPYNYNRTKDIEALKEFNYKLKSKWPNCFVLGEQLSGDANEVAPFYASMDSLFDFDIYYNLPRSINGSDGLSVDYAAYMISRDAQLYSRYRQYRPINSMISSNHDIPRLSSYFNDTEHIKLYFAVIMTLPGLSWIYYGDEIGLQGAASDSDSSYRQSMKWTANWQYKCVNDISNINLNSSTVSVAEQETNNSSLLNYVRNLTKLRNDYPVLMNGTATCSVENGMLKIRVTDGSTTLTVYHNFTSSAKSVSGTAVFGSTSVAAYGTTVVR